MNKTKTLKKALSLVLVLLMVVSTMMIVPMTTSAADITVGGTRDGLSEATAFQVGSKADMQQLKELAVANFATGETVYVELTNDFEMPDFYMENQAYSSSQTAGLLSFQFDGKGYTISGITKPMFVGAKGNMSFKNLNLEVNDMKVYDSFGTVLLGYATGTEYNFENVTVSGTMTYNYNNNGAGARVVGIFVADIGAAGSTYNFTNCVNNVDVTVEDLSRAAGFIGSSENVSTTINMTNCVNNGSMVVPAGLAAGFVAYHVVGTLTITNCLNTGDMTTNGADSVDAHPPVSAAGFVGAMGDGGSDAEPTSFVSIKNSINEGTINAVNTGNSAAFVGHAKRAKVTLNSCYDKGLSERQLVGKAGSGSEITVENTAALADVYALISFPRANAVVGTSTTMAQPKLAYQLDENPDNDAEPNSAENPYIITTPGEMDYFAPTNTSYVVPDSGKLYVKLGNDISYGNGWCWGFRTQGTNAAGTTVSMDVTFDGDNYTIKDGKFHDTSRGFFQGATKSSYAKGNLTVSNLHFANMHCPNNAGQVGIVTPGITEAGKTVTLTNVTTASSCRVYLTTNAAAMGGFIGRHEGGTLIIDRCVNGTTLSEAGVNSTSGGCAQGGFVGYMYNTNGAKLTVTNSVNEGGMGRQVTGANSAGAIVGYTTSSDITLTNAFSSSGLYNGRACDGLSTLTNCYTPFEVLNPANAAAIREINKQMLVGAGVSSTVTVDGVAKRATRLKLTDDFGFMAIADITSNYYNPFGGVYGMVVVKGEADAATLMASGKFVEAEVYEVDPSKFCVAYTDISVATMNEKYTYATAIAVDGEVVAIGTIYDINCYTQADEIADNNGKLADGTVVTKAQDEINLYGAMVNYYDKYDAYLTYLNSLNEQ